MDFEKLQREVWAALQDYANAVKRGSRFVKIILIAGGAAIAAAGLAFDIAHANHEVSAWTIAGLAGAAFVFIGSAFDAFKETDAAKALVTASRTLDLAKDHANLDKVIDRGFDLYISMDAMRGAIEQSLDLPDIQIPKIVQTCLSAANNTLLGAFDFGIKDIWTICVFMARADKESGKVSLHCIGHLRKIPCEIEKTRVWPEGVGVAGIAYSMNKEMIIEDMSSPDSQATFELKELMRDYDKARYASMVAVPIMIGTNPKPWGVAVVTSDRPKHFLRQQSYGVATAEPIRAIAAMTALAVKAAEGVGRRTEAVAPASISGETDAVPAAAQPTK